SEWIESLKGNFKRERRPLQEISEQAQKMKQKHGNVTGRPLKQSVNEAAARREEPLSPRPTIQVRMDKFAIYLAYEFTTETISFDQALAIIISLYAIFEVQFGAHNRVIHLLNGIFMQQPEIDYKELEPNRLTTSNISVTNKSCARTTTDLLYIEIDEADRFVEDEHDESLTERIRNSTAFDKVTIESSVLATSNYHSNESTKYTLCANTAFIVENQTKQSQSSTESLLDDPSLFIDMKSVKRHTFDTASDCDSSRCSNENKKRSPTNDKHHEMEVDTYRKIQQLLQEQQQNAVLVLTQHHHQDQNAQERQKVIHRIDFPCNKNRMKIGG
ncbi:unnamed protein product, partial [Rotaria magnacalcarata]